MILRPTIFAVALAVLACSSKKGDRTPAPEVTGLAAIPATAEVVIGGDPTKLDSSPLVGRIVDSLLGADRKLADRWAQFRTNCKIDVAKQVTRFLVALGPSPTNTPQNPGPTLLVAIGSIPENTLTECIGKLVGKGGGSVTGTSVGDKTVYQAREGQRAIFFAYGRPDTVVIGNNEAYVIEAIGAGRKLPDNTEMSGWLSTIDQNSPLWGVGRVDAKLQPALVTVLPNLKAGPRAFLATLDLRDGAKISFAALMASPEDAKQLESVTIEQRKGIVMAAQARSLGRLVNKFQIRQAGNLVWFEAALSMIDVNDLMSALDGKGQSAQDSPPE